MVANLLQTKNVAQFGRKESMVDYWIIVRKMQKMIANSGSALCIYLEIKHYFLLPFGRKII
jgi:hypothetical protein